MSSNSSIEMILRPDQIGNHTLSYVLIIHGVMDRVAKLQYLILTIVASTLDFPLPGV